jgi:hypothetical protein
VPIHTFVPQCSDPVARLRSALSVAGLDANYFFADPGAAMARCRSASMPAGVTRLKEAGERSSAPLANNLFIDGAVVFEQLGRYAQCLHLLLLRVGNKAAMEHSPAPSTRERTAAIMPAVQDSAVDGHMGCFERLKNALSTLL